MRSFCLSSQQSLHWKGTASTTRRVIHPWKHNFTRQQLNLMHGTSCLFALIYWGTFSISLPRHPGNWSQIKMLKKEKKKRWRFELKYWAHILKAYIGSKLEMAVSSHRTTTAGIPKETLGIDLKHLALGLSQPSEVRNHLGAAIFHWEAVRRKICPAGVLKHDRASWDTLCGHWHTKTFCYL